MGSAQGFPQQKAPPSGRESGAEYVEESDYSVTVSSFLVSFFCSQSLPSTKRETM